ncbi:MAG: succinate dehydrogenase cytochrome b subunit [Bacteroidia bacterium]|nr:succinate dehydrogenase cytochrome b subunit [Bacteroidia bacterium]
MSNIFSASIGQKLIMSISGLFLVIFLLVHLTVNSLLLANDGMMFNVAAHFMATNPVIRIIEPLLAIGFIIHIFYASLLTLMNMRARPVKYYKVNQKESSTWASRNMYILGAVILIFLVIHIANFYWKLKFGEMPTVNYGNGKIDDTYSLVSGLFIRWWWFDLLYMAGAVFLGLHLTHAFWSLFQTLGWNNDIWRHRLEIIGTVYAYIIAIGFSVIPLYFLISGQSN